LKQTEFYKNHKEIFKDVIIEKNTNENDDDVVCNICLDGEWYEQDEIVFCEGCAVAVHQTCYGSEIAYTLPTMDWFCHKCVHALKSSTHPSSIKWMFCSELQGPMKRVDEQNWAHVAWVNWTAELAYKNEK